MDRIEPKKIVLKDGRRGLIREAQISDAKGLLDLFDAIVEGDDYNVTNLADVEKLKMTVEKEQEYIKNHAKDGNIVLVTEIDNQVVGMVGIENGIRQRISHVGSLHINVLKPFRGNGIGTSMLKQLFEWAKHDPVIEKIGLGVFENNARAIDLYKKFGFVEEGRRVREIKMGPDEYVDSILMYKLVN